MIQRIATLNSAYLARHFHGQKGGFVCSALTISALPYRGTLEINLAKHYLETKTMLTKEI